MYVNVPGNRVINVSVIIGKFAGGIFGCEIIIGAFADCGS